MGGASGLCRENERRGGEEQGCVNNVSAVTGALSVHDRRTAGEYCEDATRDKSRRVCWHRDRRGAEEADVGKKGEGSANERIVHSQQTLESG